MRPSSKGSTNNLILFPFCISFWLLRLVSNSVLLSRKEHFSLTSSKLHYPPCYSYSASVKTTNWYISASNSCGRQFIMKSARKSRNWFANGCLSSIWLSQQPTLNLMPTLSKPKQEIQASSTIFTLRNGQPAFSWDFSRGTPRNQLLIKMTIIVYFLRIGIKVMVNIWFLHWFNNLE